MPNILYACECAGRFFKDCFANKIEKNYVSIYKQILRVKKTKKDVTKTFAEIGRTPLKINVEIKIFISSVIFIEKTDRFFLRRKSRFRRMGEI